MEKTSKNYPSFLTKSEMDWLLGNTVTISKSYQYKMKSSIRKKWLTFLNLDLPILEKSGIISDNLTVFRKDLTIYGKVENSSNPPNPEIQSQNMVGRKGCVTISVLRQDF